MTTEELHAIRARAEQFVPRLEGSAAARALDAQVARDVEYLLGAWASANEFAKDNLRVLMDLSIETNKRWDALGRSVKPAARSSLPSGPAVTREDLQAMRQLIAHCDDAHCTDCAEAARFLRAPLPSGPPEGAKE